MRWPSSWRCSVRPASRAIAPRSDWLIADQISKAAPSLRRPVRARSVKRSNIERGSYAALMSKILNLSVPRGAETSTISIAGLTRRALARQRATSKVRCTPSHAPCGMG